MFALCNRYITDPYEAEDVMMAGFLQLFSRVDQYSGEGSFEGWVRRIMVTQALQFLRKSKSMEVVRVDLEINHTEPQTTHEAVASLDHEILLTLVQRLPMGYRTVFNLYAIEGYNHLEISDMLGISEGASKSQLHKARALLQSWVLKINQQAEANTN